MAALSWQQPQGELQPQKQGPTLQSCCTCQRWACPLGLVLRDACLVHGSVRALARLPKQAVTGGRALKRKTEGMKLLAA